MAENSPSKTTTTNFPALVPQGVHAGSKPLMLKRPATVIGAESHCHLHLISSTVSKHHAVIVNGLQGAYVRDLVSRTGVIVNDKPVRESPLKDGDFVQIGKFHFKFVAPKIARPAPVDAPKAVVDVQDAAIPVPIDGKMVLIGRRSGSDIPLLESSVSTCHAIIFELGGRRYLRDLNSRTGTFLNGSRIHQEEVRIGDLIRIGETDLQLKGATESPVATPEPVARPTVAELDQEVARALGDTPTEDIDLASDPDVSNVPGSTDVMDAVVDAPAAPPRLPPSPATGESISDLVVPKSEPVVEEPIPVEHAEPIDEPALPQRGWHATEPAPVKAETEKPIELDHSVFNEAALAPEPPPVVTPEPVISTTEQAPTEVHATASEGIEEEIAIDHAATEPVELPHEPEPVEIAPLPLDVPTSEEDAIAIEALSSEEFAPVELEIEPVAATDAPEAKTDLAEPAPTQVHDVVETLAAAPEAEIVLVEPAPSEITATHAEDAIAIEALASSPDVPVEELKIDLSEASPSEPQVETRADEIAIEPEVVAIEPAPTEVQAASNADTIEMDAPVESPAEPMAEVAQVETTIDIAPPPVDLSITLNPAVVDQPITSEPTIAEIAPEETKPKRRGRKPAVKVEPVAEIPKVEEAEKKAPAKRGRKPKRVPPVAITEPVVELPAFVEPEPIASAEIIATVNPAIVEPVVDISITDSASTQDTAPPDQEVTGAMAEISLEPPPLDEEPAPISEEIIIPEPSAPVSEPQGIDFSKLKIDEPEPLRVVETPAPDSDDPLNLADSNLAPAAEEEIVAEEVLPVVTSPEAEVFQAVIRHEPESAPKLDDEPAIAGLQVRPEDFSASASPQLEGTVTAAFTPPVTPSVYEEEIVSSSEPNLDPVLEMSPTIEPITHIDSTTLDTSDEEFAAMMEDFSSQPAEAPVEPTTAAIDAAGTEPLEVEQSLGEVPELTEVEIDKTAGVGDQSISTSEPDFAPLPPPFTFSESTPPRPQVNQRPAFSGPRFDNEPFTLDDGFFGGGTSVAKPAPQPTGATFNPAAVDPTATNTPPSVAPPAHRPIASAIAASGIGGTQAFTVDHFVGGMPLRLPNLPAAPSTFGRVGVSFESPPPISRSPQAPVVPPQPLTDDRIDETPPVVPPAPTPPTQRQSPAVPPKPAMPATPPPAFARLRSAPAAPPPEAPADDVNIHDLSEAVNTVDTLSAPVRSKASTAFDGLAMPPMDVHDPFSMAAPTVINDAVFGGMQTPRTEEYVPESPEAAAQRDDAVDKDFAEDEFWNRTDEDDTELPAALAPEPAAAADVMHPGDESDAVSQAEHAALQPPPEEPAKPTSRGMRGAGRPIMLDTLRRPPAIPAAAEPKKKRKKLFGFLGVLMLLCLGGALAAIWLRPVPSTVSAFITFNNVDLVAGTSTSKNFVAAQKLILENPETRLAAATKFAGTHPDKPLGFLADPDQFKTIDSSMAPNYDAKHNQATIEVAYNGTDAAGDKDRVAAVMEAVIDANAPAVEENRRLVKAADDAKDAYEKAMARKKALLDQIPAKSTSQARNQNMPTLQELTELQKKQDDLKVAWDNARLAAEKDQLALQELQTKVQSDSIAATQPTVDPQLEQMRGQIAEISKQATAAATTSEPVETADARKKLEQANDELTLQLADAGNMLTVNPKLKEYVDSARDSQAKARQLTTALITDGEDFEKQLEVIRNQIDENRRVKQNQLWAQDPTLKLLNENLQIAQHQLNAAKGGGLNDPKTLAKYQQDIDRYTNDIIERKSQVVLEPGDTTVSQLVNDLINTLRQKLEKEKKDIDAVFDPLNKSFDQTYVNALPAGQQDLAKKIQAKLNDLSAARQRYAALTSGPQLMDLQKQLAQLKTAADKREHDLADQQTKSLALEQKSLADAKQNLETETKLAAAAKTDYEDELLKWQTKTKDRTLALAESDKTDILTIELNSINEKEKALSDDKEKTAQAAAGHTFDIAPFNPNNLTVSTSDRREVISLYALLAIFVLFACIAFALIYRGGTEADQHARPLPIESINDFPGVNRLFPAGARTDDRNVEEHSDHDDHPALSL